jgi:hypothetical protein
MKRLECICLVVFLALAQMSNAQAVVHNYGSLGSDEYTSIVPCPNGGFVAIGTTGGEVGSQTDVYLSKLNALLDCEWTLNIGGIGIERGNDVVVAPDGSIYFCGMILSNSVAGYKNLVGKVDANGNLLWSQEFGEGVWDEARNIVIDGVGNILVATNSFFPSGEELVVMYSLNEAGVLSAPMNIESAGVNNNVGLEYYNGELYVLNNHDESTNPHYSVRKIDSFGNVLQNFEVPGAGAQSHDIHVSANGVLIVGEFLNGTFRNSYSCAYQLDGTIDMEIFTYRDYNMWYKTAHSNSEGYTIAGETTDFGFGENEWILHRYDFQGQYNGGGTVGTNKFEYCKDVLVVNDTVYLVGSSNGFELNKQQQATVYWYESITLADLIPTTVNNDCFYVGTEDLEIQESLSFNAIGNNVFQTSTQVNKLNVQIYSIDGKLTLNHSGSNEFQVNASPGIYFLVFQSEKQSGVQKISIR